MRQELTEADLVRSPLLLSIPTGRIPGYLSVHDACTVNKSLARASYNMTLNLKSVMNLYVK